MLEAQENQEKSFHPPFVHGKFEICLHYDPQQEPHKVNNTLLCPFHKYSIFRYDADISGTLVAYNDKSFKSVEQTVSLKNRPGEAYLNFTLEVDVVIFSPEPGSFLRAVCKEVALLYRIQSTSSF